MLNNLSDFWLNWIIPEDPNKFVDAAGLEEAEI